MSLEGPISGSESPTEGILDDARDLDQKSVAEVLELMHREDAQAHPTEAGLTQGMEWPEGVGRGPEPQGLVQRTRRSATARVALFLNGPRSGPAGG